MGEKMVREYHKEVTFRLNSPTHDIAAKCICRFGRAASLSQREVSTMNDILQGNWKQLHGQIREWWGKLTDDDLTKIDGKRENLVGVLQTKYGYAKDRAETEVNARLAEWEKAQSKRETMAPKK
jgi:uncharacterized protein YjbJ (UPF0337 family)